MKTPQTHSKLIMKLFLKPVKTGMLASHFRSSKPPVVLPLQMTFCMWEVFGIVGCSFQTILLLGRPVGAGRVGLITFSLNTSTFSFNVLVTPD